MVIGPVPLPEPPDHRYIIAPGEFPLIAHPNPPIARIIHVWKHEDLWRRVGSLEFDEPHGLWVPAKRLRVKRGKGWVEVEEWSLSNEEKLVAALDLGGGYWWTGEAQNEDTPGSTPHDEWSGGYRFWEPLIVKRLEFFGAQTNLATARAYMAPIEARFEELRRSADLAIYGAPRRLSSTPCPPPDLTQPTSSLKPSQANATGISESMAEYGTVADRPPSSSSGSI